MDGIYYETYGRGPQVGYVETPDLSVFEVSRTWFQPWKAKRLSSDLVLKYRQNPDCLADAYAPECRIEHRQRLVALDPEMQRRLQALNGSSSSDA